MNTKANKVDSASELLVAQAYSKDFTKLSPYCVPALREVLPKCGYCGAEMDKDGAFPTAVMVGTCRDGTQAVHSVLAVCPDCVAKANIETPILREHAVELSNDRMLNLLQELFDYALGRVATENGFPVAVMNLNFLMKDPLAWNPRDTAVVFGLNTRPIAVHFVYEADDQPFAAGAAVREAEAYGKLIKAGRVKVNTIGRSHMLESSDPTVVDFVNDAVNKGQIFPPKGKCFGIIGKEQQ